MRLRLTRPGPYYYFGRGPEYFTPKLYNFNRLCLDPGSCETLKRGYFPGGAGGIPVARCRDEVSGSWFQPHNRL